MENGKRNLAVYIHLPFCVRKCLYCDFNSGLYSEEVRRNYVNQLLREIEWFFDDEPETNNLEISTVFFGGGTPSILHPDEIETILCKLKDSLCKHNSKLCKLRRLCKPQELCQPNYLCKPKEITIEVNPGTVVQKNMEQFRRYREMGINRVSIGLQSVNDNELKILGRIHTYEDFLKTYEAAVEAGFTNINVDLIYAVPGQTFESFEKSIRTVASLNPRPSHISAYSLIVEEGTQFFGRDFAKEGIPLPDEEEERRMYRGVSEILKEYGYEQYEISNYALPGFECNHNLSYWTRGEYAGFGVSASSLRKGVRDYRYRNTSSMEKYMNASSYDELKALREEVEELSREDQMSEAAILALRLNRGLASKKFYDEFGKMPDEVFKDAIEKHIREGLLEISNEGDLKLTENGRDLANYVMADFL